MARAMNVPNSRLLMLLAVPTVVLAAYLFWPYGGDEPAPVAGSPEPQAEAGEAPELEVADAAAGEEPEQLTRRARQLGESRQAELRKIAVSQHRLPHDVPLQDYKAALWSDIQANPPPLETLGDPELDAEAAYTQYMYYGMCSVAPRTGRQADRAVEQLAERAERVSGRYLRGIERRVNRTIDMYDLCSRIPAEVDCRREALLWMAEAVRLGHEIAQVQYYEKAMGFLLRPDPYTGDAPLAMQQPPLISEFEVTSRLALEGALEKGHPEAYLAMSKAVFEGVVYPRDPVMALAYARAAELEAMNSRVILSNLDQHKFAVSQFLDAGQIADAEELARQLRIDAGR